MRVSGGRQRSRMRERRKRGDTRDDHHCALWFVPAAARTGGQRLLELASLLAVRHLQGVQEAAAADLELGAVGGLLDLDGASVLPARGLQEVTDVGDLFRLRHAH